jgi:mannose-6-phosphate isomerase-like protein (cupin superfamily)
VFKKTGAKKYASKKDMFMKPTNLAEKLALIGEHWHPRIVGEVNDSYVKLAKLKGEFIWHEHRDEDELFLVVKGRLIIRLKDGEVEIGPGEFYIVPRGVSHLPVAVEEVEVLLLEPKSTVNTGGEVSDRTVESEWL